MKKVAIIMGSDSDLPIAEKAAAQLKALDIPFEVHVMSAHRTPDEACAFAKSAKENGFGVLISIAGMAAHLGGVLAANTTLPIIGVPGKSSFEGLDALLATVQMPPAFPWQPLRSTARKTQPFSRRRCSRFPTKNWTKSLSPCGKKWRTKCGAKMKKSVRSFVTK